MSTWLNLVAVIPEPIQDFGQEVGKAWPIIVLLVFFVGGFYRLVKSFKRWLSDEITEQLSPIVKELQFNGGSSLKDKLTDVATRLDVFLETQDHPRHDARRKP